MRSTRYVAFLLLATTCGFAQDTKRTAPLTSGALSGRVFLITQSGDLKVARLAHIYFLYSGSLKQGETTNTAAWKFLSILVSEEQQLSDQLSKSDAWNPSAASILKMYSPPSNTSEADERQVCLRRRLQYTSALSKTSEWIDENKKSQQLQSTDTDEEGMFVKKLPAGIYEIIATGQAGMNEAIWTKEDMIVVPRRAVSVKLTSPEVSCVIGN